MRFVIENVTERAAENNQQDAEGFVNRKGEL
jgi:hypothetical protein